MNLFADRAVFRSILLHRKESLIKQEALCAKDVHLYGKKAVQDKNYSVGRSRKSETTEVCMQARRWFSSFGSSAKEKESKGFQNVKGD